MVPHCFSPRWLLTIAVTLYLFNLYGLGANARTKIFSGSRYTLSYPRHWNVDTSQSLPILKGTDGINISIAETPPTDKTPKQFAEDSLKHQAQEGDKFVVTDKKEYQTIPAGYPAFLIGFLDGEDESHLHFVKLPDNRIIVFSVSKDEKFTTDEQKATQEIVNSILFKK